MIKLLVIADDFTGALDTGVQFSKKGIKTLVSTNMEIDLEIVEEDIQVLVVDTESRHIRPEEAAGRVYSIVKRCKAKGVLYYYKKTDSTLRGNIGSELTAMLDACKGDEIMFIPAFPVMGRTTVKGHQFVNGIPLNETAFAKDPIDPMEDSFIPDIIKKQSGINVRNMANPIDEIEQGHYEADRTIYLFDAKTDEDMFEIGRALKNAGKLGITAGCAGFAQCLPELLELVECGQLKSPEFATSNMLVISGSVNEASIRQAKAAEASGFESITLTPEEKLLEDYTETPKGKKLVDTIAKAVRNRKDILIKTVSSRDDADKWGEYVEKLSLDKEKLHLIISSNMAKLTKKVLDEAMPDTLVIFGGDTAIAVMEAIGCQGILPMEEIVHGVAVSQIISETYRIKIITKAGGFGGERVVCDIKEYLEKRIET